MAPAASASPNRTWVLGLLLLLPWLVWADSEEDPFWQDIGQVNEGALYFLKSDIRPSPWPGDGTGNPS